MKLIGKLKENVEKTESKEDAKKVIAEAGILLKDDELETVAGGGFGVVPPQSPWITQ